MKKILIFGLALVIIISFAGIVMGGIGKNGAGKAKACTTIQSGTLLTSYGEVITTGSDEWGYNYQGRLFNGYFCEAYRNASWCQSFKDMKLHMNWNDAWLSNKDCDGDNLLDKHYGYDSYIGSGAWVTNHQNGEYIDRVTGEVCKWNYFVKIVAVPEDAYEAGYVWYTDDGIEIGQVTWDHFALIEQVKNDPCRDLHGLQFVSPAGAGLGIYKP